MAWVTGIHPTEQADTTQVVAAVRRSGADVFGAPEAVSAPGGVIGDYAALAFAPASGRLFAAWPTEGAPVVASRAPVTP